MEISFNGIFDNGLYENLLDLSDGTLRTEDGSVFNVHRIILARGNRYFRALYCGIGKGRTDILIPGIKGEVLDHILSYIYTGVIHLNHENVYELLVAADYLLVDSLVQQIKEFAEENISLDNCLPIFTTALKINQDDILRGSYRFIQTHFEALVESDRADFGEISFESVKRFLNDSNLCVRGEHVIWSAVVKWIQSDTDRRLCLVCDLLKCLKLADVKEQLATEVVHSDIIAKNPHCKSLNEIKSRSKFANSLDILLEYFAGNMSSDFYGHRHSGCLHVIARYHVQNLSHGVQIYVTYDENVDMWRKLGETDFCPTYFLTIGNNVYMFDAYNNSSIVFNLFEKNWTEMRNFRIPRLSYRLVNLRNVIYVLGGEGVMSGDEVMDVEFYHPLMELWFRASSMLPVTSFAGVAFRENIFVVGKMPDELGLGMVAQFYDAENDTWSLFPPPSIFRFDFAFVAYRGKLYVIGGSDGSNLLKSVEVFDFDRNRWEMLQELPHSYYLPKAIVLNDQLIVFDTLMEDPSYMKKNPPVSWNDAERAWESLGNQLPMNDLALYLFSTIDDSELINAFLKENRDPRTIFEKSPFN